MICPYSSFRGWNGNCLNENYQSVTSGMHRAKKVFAVTFIVHASRGEEATTTIRLSVVVAIAKGRAFAEEGWQVFITGPDGVRYCPSEFDKLLSLNPAVHSRS
jgi:hypothetical protein